MPDTKCRSCGAPVRWVTTVRGRVMPLDAAPAHQTGEARPADLAGLFVVDAEAKACAAQSVRVGGVPDVLTESLYLTHFVTCPDRDKWRLHNPAPKVKP